MVATGDVVARFEEVTGLDGDFGDGCMMVHQRREAVGKNCRQSDKDPNLLVAEASGMPVFKDGKVSVRTIVRLDGDVDYSVGNIDFVGDVVVTGDVYPGFTVTGANVEVDGFVDGAFLYAGVRMNVRSGVKGGRGAKLESGLDMELAFCENARLVVGRDLFIHGSSMHNIIYAARRVVVGDRLVGGRAYVTGSAAVVGRLGSSMGAGASVVLGYDPVLLRRQRRLKSAMRALLSELKVIRLDLERYDLEGEAADELKARFRAGRERLAAMEAERARLMDEVKEGRRVLGCRLDVPGEVMPGVEIAIGDDLLKISEAVKNVSFTNEPGRGIVMTSPAAPVAEHG